MPQLPTIEVNEQQLALIMESFDGAYGSPGQPATIEEAYTNWLILNLRTKIYSHRMNQIATQYDGQRDQAMEQMRLELQEVLGG